MAPDSDESRQDFGDALVGVPGVAGAVGAARPLEIPMARPWRPGNPLLLADISAGRAALHLVIMLGAFAMVLMLITGYAILDTGGEFMENPESADITVMLVLTAVGGAVMSAVAIGLMRLARLPASAIGVGSRSFWLDVLLGIPVAILSYVAFIVSFGVMMLIWPDGASQLRQNVERIDGMIPDLDTWVLVLLMVVVAAYEEILFRGFLLTHLRRITRSWTVAIVLGGALFAVLHIGEEVGSQTTATVVPLFAAGVLWSLMLIWRRSLVPGIVGHALFNSAQLVFMRHFSEHSGV